jgi:hypothetical protein
MARQVFPQSPPVPASIRRGSFNPFVLLEVSIKVAELSKAPGLP